MFLLECSSMILEPQNMFWNWKLFEFFWILPKRTIYHTDCNLSNSQSIPTSFGRLGCEHWQSELGSWRRMQQEERSGCRKVTWDKTLWHAGGENIFLKTRKSAAFSWVSLVHVGPFLSFESKSWTNERRGGTNIFPWTAFPTWEKTVQQSRRKNLKPIWNLSSSTCGSASKEGKEELRPQSWEICFRAFYW